MDRHQFTPSALLLRYAAAWGSLPGPGHEKQFPCVHAGEGYREWAEVVGEAHGVLGMWNYVVSCPSRG